MKLSSLAISGALFLMTAAPALAQWYWPSIGNFSDIDSTAKAKASTGNNVVINPGSFNFSNNSIISGEAKVGAMSTVTGVNATNTLFTNVWNGATVDSSAKAKASTGNNMIIGGGISSNGILSGNALVESVSTVTNVNVTGFSF